MLFGYLSYDGSGTSNILKSVKIMTGKDVSEEELSRMLENGDGVHYLTSSLNECKSPEEASYMVLDTRLPIVESLRAGHGAELGDTASICIYKNALVWQGGFVSTYKKLVEFICNRQGNTPKLKKACKACVSLYVAADRLYKLQHPEIMEKFLEEEACRASGGTDLVSSAENGSIDEATEEIACTVEENKEQGKKKKAASASATKKSASTTKKGSTTKKKNASAKKSGATVTKAKRTTSAKKKDTSAESVAEVTDDKVIFIPNDVAEYIDKYMLDRNEFWTVDNIKIVLWRTILVALKQLNSGKSGSFKANKNYLIVNSGFIGDNYEYILVSGKLGGNSGEYIVKDVSIVRGREDLKSRGFDRETDVKTLLEGISVKVDSVDFSDRGKMIHCIEERGFRLGIDIEKLDTVQVRTTMDRIKSSIELCMSLESKGIKMLVPFCFFTGNGEVQYLAPVYLSVVPKLAEPDGAVIIGKKNGDWEVETAADIKMALHNAIVIDKYVNTPWLSISKANTY